jgi:hypothetical protein
VVWRVAGHDLWVHATATGKRKPPAAWASGAKDDRGTEVTRAQQAGDHPRRLQQAERPSSNEITDDAGSYAFWPDSPRQPDLTQLRKGTDAVGRTDSSSQSRAEGNAARLRGRRARKTCRARVCPYFPAPGSSATSAASVTSSDCSGSSAGIVSSAVPSKTNGRGIAVTP